MQYETPIDEFILRQAKSDDSSLIVEFIEKLADYENFSGLLTVTPQKIRTSLFEKKQAHCLIGEYRGIPVCFCIYFYNYSVLTGQANIHIEAIFVLPEHRGKGFGTRTLKNIAKLGLESGCLRVDWACLKWNTTAANFYVGIGAQPLCDRDIYRLEGESLKSFALLSEPCPK